MVGRFHPKAEGRKEVNQVSLFDFWACGETQEKGWHQFMCPYYRSRQTNTGDYAETSEMGIPNSVHICI